jgi:hypothetical protein
MRVRMTRNCKGEVDGIELKMFKKGCTYDLPTSIATYLVTTASADAVASNSPASTSSLSEVRISSAVQTFHEVAAERGRARRKLLES